MGRTYEAVYIFDSALEDSAITEKLDRFHALLPQPAEGAHRADDLGQANPRLPNRREGDRDIYVVAKFEAEATSLPEFERALKLDEGLLRHLVVLDEGAQMAPTPSAKDGEDED